jgi:hypothetical protein
VNRDVFGDKKLYAYLVAGAFIAGLCLLIVNFCGCGGGQPEPKAPDVAACLSHGIEEMLMSKSCRAALQSLGKVARDYPECAQVLTPAGSLATALTLGAVTLLCDDWELDPGDGGRD